MKKFNFKSFLAKRDKNTNAATLLTEGLADIKEMVFPHVDMNSAIKFLRVMPGWKNSTLNAEIELNFSDDEEIGLFRDKCNNTFTAQNIKYLNNGFQQDVKSAGGAVTVYELAKPEGLPENLFEQFCSQMFATVMRFFKMRRLNAPMRIVKRDGGKILIKSNDANRRATVWKKIDNICGNKAISDGIAAVTAGMAEMKTTKDAARKDQLKSELKKRGDDIMTALNAIPAESEPPSDEDRAKIRSSTKTEESRRTVLYRGNCEECFYVYLLYLQATAGDKAAAETLGLLNTVYAGQELRRTIGLGKIIEAGLSYYALGGSYKQIADGFIKNVKLTGDVGETQRRLLQMLNALVAPRPKDWAENIDRQIQAVQAKAEKEQDAGVKAKMQQELTKLNAVKNSPQPTIHQVLGFIKDNHIGLCIVNYLKNRAQEIKSVKTAADAAEQNNEKFDVDAAMAKIRPDVTRYGDLAAMFEAVINDTKNIFSDVKDETAAAEAEKRRKIEAMKTARPQLENKVAARRQKLFEAVRAYGGEVFADENWTASICSTSKQLGVFARNKPKTAGDRKTILQGVNLEDGEGITAANKKIRDGSGIWIADGISKKFDTQETETCWCCCGSYCNYDKSINQQTPKSWGHAGASSPSSSGYSVTDGQTGARCLVQFMDNHTGRLFMLGNQYILDEADGYTGGITGSGGISTLRQSCQALPQFSKFVKDSGLWDRFAENKKTKVKTDAELMSEAIAAGIITDDGEMHLANRGQLSTYGRLIERVSKINVEAENAERFFMDVFGETVLESLVVDCRRVKNADSMFKGIHARAIILENTENVESMQSMFAYTVTENIQGLDTRSVKNMHSAFCNCRQKVFKMVSIPALDLRNCQEISHCFEKSYISSVNMQNTDNITNAVDAFVDMPLLQSVPDVKFKNIMSPEQLRYDFNGDYVTIFDGCDRLLGGKKFDEEILKIEKFYQHPERKNKFTDERGYLIIRSQTDAASYAKDFYKYPGVVLDKNIPSTLRLFHDISHMKIRVLDVNGLPSLNELIYRCQSFSIGAIVGTQSVVSAEKMFAYSSCSICPRLSLPALRGQITVFRTMYPFGNVNSSGFFETGAYVQPFTIPNDENYVENAARNLFGETVQEWIDRVSIENAVEGLYTSKIENRRNMLKSRYKTGEDGFIEISDLADFSENMPDILELKPKGLRFSRELVETLNKLESLPDGIWSKASAGLRVRNIPKLDLNGLANANSLFKGAILGRIDGIAGLESVVQGDSMFESANISNLGEVLRGQTFVALKSANSMFRDFDGGINIQDMKFPVLESARYMFMHCSMPLPPHTISFQRVTNADYMFYGCGFGKIQSVDMPSAAAAGHMFEDCSNLESIGTVTMPQCRGAESMFCNCYGLKVIGELELGHATNVDDMFAECNALKNIHICRMGAGSANTGAGVFYDCPLREIYGVSGEPFFARAKLLSR